MKILAVDVGGTHVKILATGENAHRKFSSGPTITARQTVTGVKKIARGWTYDVVSIGYPGPVLPTRGGAAQPRPWLGRVRLSGRVQTPRRDRQRCGHAGTG